MNIQKHTDLWSQNPISPEVIQATENALKKGVHLTLQKFKDPTQTLDVCISYLSPEHSPILEEIVHYSQEEEAVLNLDLEHLNQAMDKELYLCATDPQGNFLAFIGAEVLSPSEVQDRLNQKESFIEFRSSITPPSYRGYGLNSELVKLQLINLYGKTGLIPAGFTDHIPAADELPPIIAKSMGVHKRAGLIPVLVSEMSCALKKVLSDPCPEGRCANRGDQASDCACALWVADIHQAVEKVLPIIS